MKMLQISSLLLVFLLNSFPTTTGLKCHQCIFMSGGDQKIGIQGFHESCKNGNTPEERFVHECGTGDQSGSGVTAWSCLIASVSGKLDSATENTEITMRTCVPTVTESNEKCQETTIKKLRNDPVSRATFSYLWAGIDPQGSMDDFKTKICFSKNGITNNSSDITGSATKLIILWAFIIAKLVV